MRGLAALCVGLVLVLGAGAGWATTSQGDGSCMGTDACDGQTGDIGDESCNAFTACQAQSGGIGDESCNDAGACISQLGDIGNKSCNGNNACQTQSGDISDKSCNGPAACQVQTGDIGDESCNKLNACRQQTGDIGDESCNGEDACREQSGSIGDGLCNFPLGCNDSSQDRANCLGGGMAVSGAVGGFDGEIDIPGCWFVGERGESCAEVCAQRGFAYDEQTATVAGSDLDICQAILGDGIPSRVDDCSEGLGCFLDTSNPTVVLCTDPPTTAEASLGFIQRACACRDTTPAPTTSPYGIAALLIALAGFGAWRLRKRTA
jgi:hypothetical protein